MLTTRLVTPKVCGPKCSHYLIRVYCTFKTFVTEKKTTGSSNFVNITVILTKLVPIDSLVLDQEQSIKDQTTMVIKQNLVKIGTNLIGS